MRRIGGECRAGRFEEDPQSPGILPRLAVPPPVEGDRGRVHQIAARREHAQKEQVWILALDKLCELLNFIKWEEVGGGREEGGKGFSRRLIDGDVLSSSLSASLVFRMLEDEEENVQQLEILVARFYRPFKMAASSKK